jgi:hypothetical protein
LPLSVGKQFSSSWTYSVSSLKWKSYTLSLSSIHLCAKCHVFACIYDLHLAVCKCACGSFWTECVDMPFIDKKFLLLVFSLLALYPNSIQRFQAWVLNEMGSFLSIMFCFWLWQFWWKQWLVLCWTSTYCNLSFLVLEDSRASAATEVESLLEAYTLEIFSYNEMHLFIIHCRASMHCEWTVKDSEIRWKDCHLIFG